MPTKIKTHTYKGFTIASYENATGAKRWMIELNGKDYKPASNFTTLTNAKNYIDSHKLIGAFRKNELGSFDVFNMHTGVLVMRDLSSKSWASLYLDFLDLNNRK